jgi:diguanylate cyclase (GGDEF)-like protein
VADRASLAIENSRLYANVQQRLRELAALHTATSALLSTLDLEELLGRILDAAQSAFPAAEEGILYLTVPGTSQLQLRAVFGYKDPRIKKIINHTGFDFPARILTEKKPVLISDTEVDPGGVQNSPFRSAIAVPLIHGASIHGIIFLSASAPRVFSVNDLHLLETFAATTTAALQNALLHGEVQKLAITDSLTGFLNRRGFDDLSSREFERAVRFGRPLSAIMIDIDHFKDINDTYGHVIGDQALSLLARRLQEVLREVDVLGRYGGDEFIALLPETDPETAAAVAERIQSSFHIPLVIGKSGSQPLSLMVSASFGVAGLNDEIKDIHTLIEKADSASYRAKQSGRNRVEIA